VSTADTNDWQYANTEVPRMNAEFAANLENLKPRGVIVLQVCVMRGTGTAAGCLVCVVVVFHGAAAAARHAMLIRCSLVPVVAIYCGDAVAMLLRCCCHVAAPLSLCVA
jgi:hypothetical protein